MICMRALLIAIVWIVLPAWAFAEEPSGVRLAVISDGDNQALAALLMTELSGSPGISLVERDDLAKVGNELKLQQMAGSNAVALGKLVGADGLIFINQAPDGFQVRFTAVGLGYALFEDQIASGTEIKQLAKSMAHRVTAYGPKLKLDPAKAIPISVLNLHADYGTPESVLLERKLTLLLESRLASLPRYVVLERRHGSSLGFEHALATDPRPLLQGAYIVDGALSLPLQNQGPPTLTIHLRLRSPGSGRVPLDIVGPADDLHGLVEKMAAEIQKVTGATAAALPWQPEKEAREYLEEGIWGWRNHADDAALEALDSAELLGESTPDLVPIRIAVLYQRAGHTLDLARQSSTGPESSGISSLDQTIDDTLRAIAEAARYDAEKLEPKLQLLTWEQHMDVRTDQIKENLSNFTSDFLVFLDARHSPRADELRQALRAITGYDPLHGKLGRADMSHPLNVLTDARDEWDLTLPEELAYYHLLATTPYQYIPSELLTGQGKGFCPRFLKTSEEQQQAFDRFVADLKDDPKGRLVYQLIKSCSADRAVADAAYTAYWQEMWNRRVELTSQKVQVEEWTSGRPVPESLRHAHAREMIPLLHYYLTHVNNYRYWEYSWDIMWQPDQWSETEAAAIWTDYLGFKQRAAADRAARGYSTLSLNEIEEPFAKKFPAIATTKPPDRAPEQPLIVNRLWCPVLEPTSPKEHSNYIVQCQAAPGNSLWMEVWFASRGGKTHALYQLSMPDLKAKMVPLPDTLSKGGHLAVTATAVYLCGHPNSKPAPQLQIARFDLQSQAWESRTLDLEYEKYFAIGNSLYFNLKGGIGRYDWDSAQFTLLASSRRKPAQNQFDDREGYQINTIFAGPGGKPCVSMLQDGTHFILDQPGKWPEVFDSCFWTESTTRQQKTLIYNSAGEVVLLDPARPEPEYLVSPTQPHYRKVASIHHQAVKEMTPWAAQTPWDAVSPHYFGSNLGGDSHCFFLLSWGHENENYHLLWYDRDHGRKPRLIPLQFVLEDQLLAGLPLMYRDGKDNRWKRSNLERPGTECNLSTIAVEDGICLNSDNLGIWFLPYRDIETYLKTHATEEPSPEPPAPVAVKIPPREEDAESQVIGDMIDPAIRAVSFR